MPRQIIDQSAARIQTPRSGKTERVEHRTGRLHLIARTELFRSAALNLDSSGHKLSDVDRDALNAALAIEFPPSAAVPKGILAKCYLGVPFEVHLLDLASGLIITHYERGQSLPSALSRARQLLSHPTYELVEIYSNHLVCVRTDGSVSEVQL